MNRRHLHHHSSGTASMDDNMQADVMRFLAIIAICLLAVLALVGNTAPAPTAVPVQVPVTPAAATPAIPLPEPAPEPAPEPVAVTVAIATPAAAPAMELVPGPDSAPASEPPPQDRGLSLRFASEQAFLTLVNSGTVQVFAWQGSTTLRLTEQFAFISDSAPGAVHEILPSTLPRAIHDSFLRQHSLPTAWQWGVRLPSRTLTQLQQQVNDNGSGVLLIDARGDIHHETT